MPVCAECVYADLQCPPIMGCRLRAAFRYIDSPACEDFKPAENEEAPISTVQPVVKKTDSVVK